MKLNEHENLGYSGINSCTKFLLVLALTIFGLSELDGIVERF